MLGQGAADAATTKYRAKAALLLSQISPTTRFHDVPAERAMSCPRCVAAVLPGLNCSLVHRRDKVTLSCDVCGMKSSLRVHKSGKGTLESYKKAARAKKRHAIMTASTKPAPTNAQPSASTSTADTNDSTTASKTKKKRSKSKQGLQALLDAKKQQQQQHTSSTAPGLQDFLRAL